MTEIDRLLAAERSFQRGAIVVAIVLISMMTLPVSVARALFAPSDQIAAASFLGTGGGAVHSAVWVSPNGLRMVKYAKSRVFLKAKRSIPKRAEALSAILPPAPIALAPPQEEPVSESPVVLAAALVPDPIDGPLGKPDLAGPIGPGRTIDTVSPVPEPASWAMTILGIGIIGGMLRRGRRIREICVQG
jgi:hypothetical protein